MDHHIFIVFRGKTRKAHVGMVNDFIGKTGFIGKTWNARI